MMKRGRPKGAEKTVVGLPNKKRKLNKPLTFLKKLPVDREKGMWPLTACLMINNIFSHFALVCWPHYCWGCYFPQSFDWRRSAGDQTWKSDCFLFGSTSVLRNMQEVFHKKCLASSRRCNCYHKRKPFVVLWQMYKSYQWWNWVIVTVAWFGTILSVSTYIIYRSLKFGFVDLVITVVKFETLSSKSQSHAAMCTMFV